MTDAEALDGVDQAELKQLMTECRKLWPLFPELTEIDQPSGAAPIPASLARGAEQFVDRVIETVESPNGRELFNEQTGELLRAERDYLKREFSRLRPSSNDRLTQDQRKIVVFGSIVASIVHALARPPKGVHAMASYAAIWSMISELWNLVRSFLMH